MRTAVVTGATGGIGSAIARRLAKDGFAVVVGYHSAAEQAQELVADLPGSGHRTARISVLEPASLEDLAASLSAGAGAVDVLVNCAGITRAVPHDDLDGLDDELVDEIFATNWRGPFATIRALRPLLEAAETSVVVNISSVSGITGQGSNVAYCASKAALDSMTRSLGRALAPSIRVVSVSPGWVLGKYAERMPPEVLDTQRNATPLGRLATADDVAAAVSAVVGDLPFTTGSIVAVDGGRPLGTS
ncbi:MAG: SDR family oxidoreductase [Acidimicrobiaceae bacterium]|nr:SDR family oxidoreductase [Acidimicrobiaceae bacterium]MYA14752.1 SDR family oxidoreductase [Acidimicrobiaceae bacterium]MYE57852.1 SDR family oxidoreductase [Acidimicrobiaceae bacterium]MYI14222.1 SDR family oxidoreductase [Acidimicrobiaceae bacterium]